MGAVKQGLINQLKIDLDECKRNSISYETEINDLKSGNDELEKLRKQNRTLRIDLEAMKLKYDQFRKELEFFDDDFLDEIKTLKKKYDDALKLNKYYENLLFYSDKHASKLNTRNKVKFVDDDDLSHFQSSDLDIGEFSNLIIEELNNA